MNQKTTKANMKLLEKGFIHPSNHTEVMYDIPLTFKLGEKTFKVSFKVYVATEDVPENPETPGESNGETPSEDAE